jgi:hypothetical protein
MLRQSVLGLGLIAAVCMPAGSANAGYADYMSLSCRVEVAGHGVQATRRGSTPSPIIIAST